ncbi:MAG: gamma-glutamyl-gamma-aminobutyrate hydrolase family protein [Nitrospirales bacterium]
MMKPIIGITPDYNAGDREDMGGKEPTYFIRARYVQAIEDAGGLPIVFPLVTSIRQQKQLLAQVDGLLVTGSGSDLDPALYGERQDVPFRQMSPLRSNLELGISKLAYKSHLPTLGICGGMQSLNVALGGTLIQDIAVQHSTDIEHLPSWSATKNAHGIAIAPKTLLHRIVGKPKIRVNSSHHQSVKKVPGRLVTSAVAPDGVIEAIEAPDHPFLLGVQWHPEFLYKRDPIQKKLFQALIKSARSRAKTIRTFSV